MDGPHVQEMSAGKRYMLFGLACSHVLLASGEAYGWTALRPVLQDGGLFDSDTDPAVRSAKMNAVATMGIAANALCKFPLGLLLDRCGPRATSVVGAIIMVMGSCLMAFADKNDQYMLMLGYFMLGTAGPFLQMPCFQFSELFGTRKASAMAYLITCFELSTGVFWVFGELHHHLAFDRKILFLGYSGVNRGAGPPKPSHNPSKPLMDKPLHKQIFSIPFLYVVCFLTVHIFRQGFLLATVGPQVEYFFKEDMAEWLKTSFNIILPLGFIPMMLCTASGFAAYILDRPRLAFVVVTLLSMVYGLLLLVPEQWAFLTLFVVFPVARQFVFSTFFSFSANTFGYASFGRIAGVASTVAGLTQLTQTKLVAYTEAPDSKLTWFLTDAALGLVPVLLFIYPIWSAIAQSMNSGKQDGWAPPHDDNEDGTDPTSPLMGRDNGRTSSVRDSINQSDEDDDDLGRVTLPYVEATSYGSHSASSFAALYTQYMEDVKVSVVPVTEDEDRSIHVQGMPNSQSSGNVSWPVPQWADEGGA